MKKKLTIITKLARGDNGGPLFLGTRVRLVPCKSTDWNTRYLQQPEEHHIPGRTRPQIENGKLRATSGVFGFCSSGLTRFFKIPAGVLKKIFPYNTISHIRLTIEILEVEEWEYQK